MDFGLNIAFLQIFLPECKLDSQKQDLKRIFRSTTMKFISFTTDFGAGSRGNGVLMAVALKIAPDASIVHFADVESFNIKSGARLLEGIAYLPIGSHVCVVDPGVGTKRRAIAIETNRGDYLVGPDNGVLLPACEFVGGIKKVVHINNEDYMLKPVSPIFHGRDIFMPVAAHLANGVAIEELGKELKANELTAAPYNNAKIRNKKIECEVIHMNKFGSLFINVLGETMEKFASIGGNVKIRAKGRMVSLPYKRTFGDVEKGKPMILNDDFGRVEVAVNQGNFANRFKIKIGDKLVLSKK